MFSVWGNWRAEGKVCFVKVSNTGCNGAKINRHNHAFLNRHFSTILFSHWQSTSNYPHVYGEYSDLTCLKAAVVESPPCVWGVLASGVWNGIISRITPMCMGSTNASARRHSLNRNHPHVYGEYLAMPIYPFSPWESPPCLWGVQRREHPPAVPVRITPMFMGST